MDVRVVRGTASGPTELASYDAALAAAGVGDYNLVAVSSVLPADATVAVDGTAPDLGPPGATLTVVEARATATGPGHVSAALGWATGDGPGIVYEASGVQSASGSRPEAGDAGEMDQADARAEVEAGLTAGQQLRDWAFDDEHVESITAEAEPGTYATAVVLAALGEAEPLD